MKMHGKPPRQQKRCSEFSLSSGQREIPHGRGLASRLVANWLETHEKNGIKSKAVGGKLHDVTCPERFIGYGWTDRPDKAV